jgi:hypothetical protein
MREYPRLSVNASQPERSECPAVGRLAASATSMRTVGPSSVMSGVQGGRWWHGRAAQNGAALDDEDGDPACESLEISSVRSTNTGRPAGRAVWVVSERPLLSSSVFRNCWSTRRFRLLRCWAEPESNTGTFSDGYGEENRHNCQMTSGEGKRPVEPPQSHSSVSEWGTSSAVH